MVNYRFLETANIMNSTIMSLIFTNFILKSFILFLTGSVTASISAFGCIIGLFTTFVDDKILPLEKNTKVNNQIYKLFISIIFTCVINAIMLVIATLEYYRVFLFTKNELISYFIKLIIANGIVILFIVAMVTIINSGLSEPKMIYLMSMMSIFSLFGILANIINNVLIMLTSRIAAHAYNQFCIGQELIILIMNTEYLELFFAVTFTIDLFFGIIILLYILCFTRYPKYQHVLQSIYDTYCIYILSIISVSCIVLYYMECANNHSCDKIKLQMYASFMIYSVSKLAKNFI